VMIWTAFATVYKTNKDITYHRANVNNPDPKDLPVYIKRMNSPNFDWLVCVTITEARFTRQDVINVSNIRNVVVLDIGALIRGTSDSNLVNDSVIRSWARAAQEDGAFSKLQVLLIRDQRDVTHQALTYLHMFPSLVLFGVQGCFSPHRSTQGVAEIHGWTTDDESGTLSKIEHDIAYGSTWDSHMTTCYKHTTALLPAGLRDPKMEEKPMLSYRLGMTHSSILTSHVLDKMIFFRSTSPRSRETVHRNGPDIKGTITKLAATSTSPSRNSLTRSNTRTIKRKKHMDVFDVFQNEFGMSLMASTSTSGAPMITSARASTTVPSSNTNHIPPPAEAPTIDTSQPPSQSGRRFMPPPTAPVRSTSTFDLMNTMTSQLSVALEARAPRGSHSGSTDASSSTSTFEPRNSREHTRRESSSQRKPDASGTNRRNSPGDDGKWSPRSKL
jgi:hypothetical protein